MRHLACLLCLVAFADEKAPVFGHGDLRYSVDLKWAKADPAVAPVVNSHALAEDKAGRLYLVTDHPKNDFIVFEKDDGHYDVSPPALFFHCGCIFRIVSALYSNSRLVSTKLMPRSPRCCGDDGAPIVKAG
jgi:hypothetical protein